MKKRWESLSLWGFIGFYLGAVSSKEDYKLRLLHPYAWLLFLIGMIFVIIWGGLRSIPEAFNDFLGEVTLW